MIRPTTTIIHRAREHARSTRKALTRFARPASFSPPPDSEAAAVRAVRNISYFRTHYAVVLWIVLLFTLAPHRRATLFFLMAMSKIGAFYVILLRTFPNSWILHKLLNQRLVLATVAMVVLVEMVISDSVGHLMFALGIGLPIVIVHAVFRTRDDLVEEGPATATVITAGESRSEKEKEDKDPEASV
ncbi:hypothetical protein ZOSMA_259G00080 [Zostera marina]|uniref:PRA1 family protein n=1 Tax=Zostera marina TaxID=29655 RepID=A0A0K9PHS1_ZOSMR|nr:hypothetical protein ZOSMA_259G00080 [Zostera marina]